MTPSKFLPPQPSFESIRKQAKKLARRFAAGAPDALARVQAQFPVPPIPLSLRDAQFVLAREHGFAGWQDLRTAVLRLEGKGLEWAAAEAERLIHANNTKGLAELIHDYPALVSWRGDCDESLLAFATSSFGDSGDPYRERMYTRLECAEFLLDAGAIPGPAVWEGAIRARATGVLQLLWRKGLLPHRLDILSAVGDIDGVRECLESGQSRAAAANSVVTEAFFCACRFQHRPIAFLLLDCCLELDPAMGERVEKWRGRSGLIEYLAEHGQRYGTPWQSVVINELFTAINENRLEEFSAWLQREPDLLAESHLDLQVRIVEHAVLKNRGAFITRLLEFHPAMESSRPRCSALVMAMDYGNAHLIPLLMQIWNLPDDLSYGAGLGNLSTVKAWFDETGRPKLGSLGLHYPANNPYVLRNLHWTPANVQHILDTALAWACMNRHFEVASFLLDRGANINTDWSTHEPASILHECAVQGNYEAAQFLIDHGIDMTIRDYRWNATAEGWAEHAVKDKNMAEFLARAERTREAQRS